MIVSSGSVPFSLSPNSVRNMVKLMGPAASFTIVSCVIDKRFIKIIIYLYSLERGVSRHILMCRKYTYYILICRVLAKRSQHFYQIISVHESISVLINHVKRFLKRTLFITGMLIILRNRREYPEIYIYRPYPIGL